MSMKPKSVSDFLNSLTSQGRESGGSPEKSPDTSDVASEGQSGAQKGGSAIKIDAEMVQLIGVLAGVFQCIIAVIQLILTLW